MPTFIKTGYWESAVKSYKGWLNLEDLIFNIIPSQTGNSGKYLTTDGSTLSWASVVAPNIYTDNGTLTGNRIVNSGGFSLTLNPVLTFGERLTGITNKTYTNSFTGTTTTTPSSFLISNDITHTGNTNYRANVHYNGINATNTGASGSGFLIVTALNNRVAIRGLTTSALIQSNNQFEQIRDDPSDVSTNGSNLFQGVSVTQSHWQTANATIYTGTITGFNNSVNIRSGTVGAVSAYRASISIGQFTSNVTLITDYYALQSVGTIGVSSGPSATITNYYGLFLSTLTVNATGTITNRWGVYAPDVAMRHYLNGKLLIGTTTSGISNVRISGLPTSSAGLVSGELWNDAGTVKIIP